MPATFDALGLRFLYPENWVIAERNATEGSEGVMLEFPGGGFFSIDRILTEKSDDEVIAAVADSITEEYEEAESEEVDPPGADPGERTVDVRFYYLDLLVLGRIILTTIGGQRYLIQIQAESRDFDRNEQVFEAILQQLRKL